MTLWQIFVGSFLLGLTGAMAPGPMLAATISRAARGGFWAGPLVVLGHGVLELAVVVGVCYGLQDLLQRDPVRGTIALCGGGLLFVLGWGMIRNARGLSLQEAGAARPSGAGSFAAGVLTSLSNPYWSLWWAVTGSAVIAMALDRGAAGAAAFYVGHVLSDLAWFSLVALLVSRAARAGGGAWMGDRLYRGLIIACGVVLLGFGVFFVWSGAGWVGWFAGGPSG